jgi:NTE family protein
MKNSSAATAFAAMFASLTLQAAPPDPPEPSTRPKIALVLSGGGARGLAHIGVLKVLHEERVPVDFIVATSMGSIVGGAYAAGRTPAEMEEVLGTAEWELMFSDRPPRQDLSFRRKEDDLRFIGKSELGLTKDGITLPRGAFGAQNLEEFLRLVSRPASDARHLDELTIPVRAVATDLVTGEIVVLRDVPLSIAMRSSMSIPGAFAPTQVDGRLLADGGLARNLPVEIALEMGADIVIAVNVGTPLLPREALGSAFGVAQQMFNILTEQNVATSLKALRAKDILISPDLRGVSFVDFERGPDLIALGEAAGRAMAHRLRALALDERAWDLWEFRRTRVPVFRNRVVDAVEVRGAVRTNPEALIRELAQRTEVEAGAVVNEEDLVRASRVLYGTGDFERVDVRTEVSGDRKLVILDVEEKAWGPHYLRFGGRAVADFHTAARFSITAQHTSTWINSWGAEWRNELAIGDTPRFATSFYQPLGPGSLWFVEPAFETYQADSDLFGLDNRRLERVTNGMTSASATLGRRLGNIGVARLGFGYERYRSTPGISTSSEGTVKDSGRYARAIVSFDTLDDANFPRRGYAAVAGATSMKYASGGDPVQTYVGQFLVPFTWGRFTLTGIGAAAHSRDDRGPGFTLGGFLNLSGTPFGAIRGPQAAIFAGLAYYRMGDLPRALGRAWYLGTSLEAGNAWQRHSDISFGNAQKAASVFLGLDSIIGPVYLGYGKTFGGDSALYLYVGRPTERN